MSIVGVWSVATLVAADATHTGRVAAVEKTRMQVKISDGTNAPTKAVWFAVSDATKVMRGETLVAFATAKIKSGERVTVVVKEGDEAGVEWACPMHPKEGRAAAGNCPLCGMPMKARERHARAAEIRVEIP